MPNLFDRSARLLMRARGYRTVRVATSTGVNEALVFDGPGALPPLVVVHGWASTGVHYVLTARRLERHVERLLLPDLPGHGWSEAPPDLSPASAMRSLIETLDSLVDRPAVLLGSSLGGLAATRYALSRPERVCGLVLVSPFGAPLATPESQALRELVRARTPLDTKRFLDRMAGRPQRRNWLFAPEMWRILNRPALQQLLDQFDSMPLLDEAERAQLTMPTTVVWGRHERLLPERQLDFWSGLPDVQIWRPEHSAHSPAVDQPDAFERMVLHTLVRAAHPASLHRGHEGLDEQ